MSGAKVFAQFRIFVNSWIFRLCLRFRSHEYFRLRYYQH